MLRRWVLFLGLLVGLGLGAQAQDRPAPPPTASEKELQAPLTLEDGKPTPGQPAEAAPSGLRAFGSLVLVLGLADASLWALKKYGRGRIPGGGGQKLRVEETLALGERRFFSFLDVEAERFRIALPPQPISLLSGLVPRHRREAGTVGSALHDPVQLARLVPVPAVEIAR